MFVSALSLKDCAVANELRKLSVERYIFAVLDTDIALYILVRLCLVFGLIKFEYSSASVDDTVSELND